MKTIKILSTLFSFVILLSCEDNQSQDATPPGSLSIENIVPTNGGGIISYSLPSDSDILFVRAEYTNSLGVDVYRVSSSHNNSIEIDGLNQNTPLLVRLFVVDENENMSQPIEVEFTPLPSFIFLVQESISITPDLGGVKIEWDNIAEKTVYVHLHITNGSDEDIRILSSNSLAESIFVRGLESVEMTFLTKVEDFDGNITDLQEKAILTPLFEEMIDKSTWTLMSQLSVNGNAWEGETTAFWDDVIDTAETNSDNSYFIIWRDQNGGTLNWPLDIVISLNKNIRIHRFKVWQRAFWYGGPTGIPYYYQEENMRSFSLYASSNSVDWTLLGEYDIGDPSDENGNIPQDFMDVAANGHDFDLEGVSEKFRYLKFSITSNYGSDTYVHGSEITLWGLDNVD
ncbi:MAG: hypothetical protein CMC51_06380 [Flavobacteriaceae bacterium]|nr:hypothetical protein [Flavobacteriaceae bacterium]|tara:strand:- start:14395 stop:15591 length:1197 start_codon:yes stop_codon:yes gene_type:complete